MIQNSSVSPLSLSGTWDIVAEGYAEVMAPILSGFSIAALNRVSLTSDMRVLDLACGPGTTTMHLATQVGEVVAQDFSAEMISQLEKAIENSRLTNIKAVVGDGHHVDSEDASFDLVISMFGLMFFPDKAQAFQEIARVLKPRGILVVGSWAPMEKSAMMTAVVNALSASGNGPSAPSQSGMLDAQNQYASLLTGTSLVIEEFTECEEFTNALNARSFWEDMEKGTAPIVMMKRFMPTKDWKKIRDKAIDYLEKNYQFPLKLGSIANIAILQKK